jgi:hypothetical protein
MNDEAKGKEHPAKLTPTRWIFHDRSEQDVNLQIIDILTDIRNILVLILIVVLL